MINSKSNYIYLNGYSIPSDVTVNGEIMPLRTGDTGKFDRDGNPIPRKNILRGEDICFLKEAIEERRRAVGKTGAIPTFSQRITRAQIGDIVSQSQDMFYEYSTPDFHSLPWEWISGFPSTSVNAKVYSLPGDDPSTGGTRDYLNMSAYSDFGVSRINKPSPIVIGDGLKASDLSALFSTVGGLKYYCQGYGPTQLMHTFSISKTDLGGNYAYYSELAEHDVDFYCRSPGLYMYRRDCEAWDAGASLLYAGYEGIVSSVSTPAFTCKCAKRGKIYGVFLIIASVYNPATHGYEDIVYEYRLKCITEGPDQTNDPDVNKYSWNYSMSIDSSRLISIVTSLKNELPLMSPYEAAQIVAGTDQSGGFGASVALLFTFPVFELRDRTRWDV